MLRLENLGIGLKFNQTFFKSKDKDGHYGSALYLLSRRYPEYKKCNIFILF